MIELHPRMSVKEIDSLVGTTVTYEVIRDGAAIGRTGSIGRIDSQFIWISGWCYLLNEPRNLRAAEAGRRAHG